ncbi:MAG: hypothetical protein IK152_02945 [Lachnospiraceae bacterium]|nr:hypothetical protein [Lachnospiraceae bacterium]
MADEELEEKTPAKDPKAEKAAAKAAKKAEKEAKKAAKKADKKNKDEDSEEESGGKLSTILLTILIIIVWLAILCVLIKLDVGGFGSTILKPILKDVPYVNLILPETAEDNIEENNEYPYATLEDAIEQIKYLELQIQELQESSGSAEVANLKAEIKRLKAFEEAQTKFETARKQFYEEVVFGNKAPSAEEYKKYYESIDAANAAELYKQVVKKTEEDKEVQDYVNTYSSMKPKQAAAAMELMGDKMDLVARILMSMDVESRAKIMDAFSSEFAARMTKIMEP